MKLPTPSAWRGEWTSSDGSHKVYNYTHKKPEDADKCVPMFTARQLNQYGQMCFEEGRDARATVDPMEEVAHQFAHPPSP